MLTIVLSGTDFSSCIGRIAIVVENGSSSCSAVAFQMRKNAAERLRRTQKNQIALATLDLEVAMYESPCIVDVSTNSPKTSIFWQISVILAVWVDSKGGQMLTSFQASSWLQNVPIQCSNLLQLALKSSPERMK